MTVITRFAPSPTGFLHIGGVRTALFNWLFARHHGGRFLLRIEDTDRIRSTQPAVDAIIEGMKWLDLTWEGDWISQFARSERHAAAARRLLDEGKAYRCFATPEELTEMRERARSEGRTVLYDGRWRNRDPADAPAGAKPVIRLKAPRVGETRIADRVQGEVTVANDQLDDMVLLRADGTPTYMLAVVVDDHDMAVSHVIRGDDHLTNAFRQVQLYKALGWEPPIFAHIPLIHGPDGAKLSKRHGALGVEAYRDRGFLPEALCNYLLRLGWSHGDDEIISRDHAIEWFSLDAVGRGPSRFDMAKLTNLNGHYIRQADDPRLTDLVLERLTGRLGGALSADAPDRIRKGMSGLKDRAKTLEELADKALFYAIDAPIELDVKATKLLDAAAKQHLGEVRSLLLNSAHWKAEALERIVREYAEAKEPEGMKLRDVAQPLRAALAGSTVSPPIFEVMEALEKNETLARMGQALDE